MFRLLFKVYGAIITWKKLHVIKSKCNFFHNLRFILQKSSPTRHTKKNKAINFARSNFSIMEDNIPWTNLNDIQDKLNLSSRVNTSRVKSPKMAKKTYFYRKWPQVKNLLKFKLRTTIPFKWFFKICQKWQVKSRNLSEEKTQPEFKCSATFVMKVGTITYKERIIYAIQLHTKNVSSISDKTSFISKTKLNRIVCQFFFLKPHLKKVNKATS